MLERLVSKNAADCTSQRVKRTSGVRVMIFMLYLHFFVVFKSREYARMISFENVAHCTSQRNKRTLGLEL